MNALLDNLASFKKYIQVQTKCRSKPWIIAGL